MLIESDKMFSFLSQTDLEKYYFFCHGILNSGNDFSLREITFFCATPEPVTDFVCLKRYGDGEDMLFALTENSELVKEALSYRKDAPSVIAPEYEDRIPCCRLITDSDTILESLKTDFSLTPDEQFVAPSYFLKDVSELRAFPLSEGVTIVCLTDENIEKIKAQILEENQSEKYSSYNEEHVGLWVLKRYRGSETYMLGLKDTSLQKTRWIGYLRAENGVGNYMDIGWVQVDIDKRGHGYAKQLVSFFSADSIKKGHIPRYSFAMSSESEKVAEACGFTQKHEFKYRMTIQ